MWQEGESGEWKELITLDIDPSCNPDIVFDLGWLEFGGQLPFPDNHFDEIHAYEVLEHFGKQGYYEGLFKTFTELHRVCRGYLFGSVPRHDTEFAWGDPGHTRIISPLTLTFLSQAEYKKQVGVTRMSDYRRLYEVDWAPVYAFQDDATLWFILRKEQG